MHLKGKLTSPTNINLATVVPDYFNQQASDLNHSRTLIATASRQKPTKLRPPHARGDLLPLPAHFIRCASRAAPPLFFLVLMSIGCPAWAAICADAAATPIQSAWKNLTRQQMQALGNSRDKPGIARASHNRFDQHAASAFKQNKT